MKYVLKYTVVIEAEDFNQAECMSADLEGDIRFLKNVNQCWCDPYMEEQE